MKSRSPENLRYSITQRPNHAINTNTFGADLVLVRPVRESLSSDMRVSDLELGFLEKHLSLINAQIDTVVTDAKGCRGLPDGFGLLR